jgi:hypothetical protein
MWQPCNGRQTSILGRNEYFSLCRQYQTKCGDHRVRSRVLATELQRTNLDMTPTAQCTGLNSSLRGMVLTQRSTFVFVYCKPMDIPPAGVTKKDYEKKQIFTQAWSRQLYFSHESHSPPTNTLQIDSRTWCLASSWHQIYEKDSTSIN